ncbi:MAG TPA: 2-amino-4-hydroxy-6-hydroxymethyldihydropteridine diphosphokinase [Moraxellaceae bacterium]|nr:2-amino-4-hydroxy-6-hydroxymethyldihydropteridine diphosphokinase [Moraxellaceae bacterium]
MTAAFIGLGGNLGAAEATLQSAVTALRALPGTRLTALSSLYRSAPVGPAGQPDYLNAVALIETELAPHDLLAALQAIERAHGRERQLRWGPRTLDLDLLLLGRDRIATADLVVPHPELGNRNFVVVPLLEIAPGATLPEGTPLASLPVARDPAGLAVLRPGPAWGG